MPRQARKAGRDRIAASACAGFALTMFEDGPAEIVPRVDPAAAGVNPQPRRPPILPPRLREARSLRPVRLGQELPECNRPDLELWRFTYRLA